ncbi:hypothetical protein [Nitratidesulfovibrio liaohensis]|uniref:Phage tail protein n=1 Tax=Nitratidesulfovibrio liaohensis TaxID=2604158 RepID=A0ABY9R3H6_9BACT|nr:hypothetical protein [Nitratidesulfovibrio liaohensis]WMW65752.1 phage tail protein [Nitratidesulfovibrio liaohensis]
MHRIDGPGATEDGRFTDGNPAAGIPPTIVTDDWANAVQEEIVGVIAGAGIALDKADNGQLLQAIKKLGPERFRGFGLTGQHEEWEADPATIDRNSLYAVRKGAASGQSPDMPDDMPAEAWAFVHTMVMPGDVARTQLLWRVDDPDHPGWWRRRSAGVWGEWKGIGSGGSGMPIGMTFWWPGTTPPAGALAINDGPLLPRAAYPQLWAMAQASGNIITEAAWQAQAAVQSSVGAFSTGDGVTTFRCPRLRDYVRGADPAGGHDVGMWLPDGLKSHNHRMGIPGGADSGWGEAAGLSNTLGEYRTETVGGTETLPKTVCWLPCIKAFDAVSNAGEVDIAALAATLAGKVDRSDWVTLVPGAAYKLPNGLIIQWGQGTASSSTGGVATAPNTVLPVAFSNTSYCVLPVSGPTGDHTSHVVIASRTTTGFVAENSNNYTQPFLFLAIGL